MFRKSFNRNISKIYICVSWFKDNRIGMLSDKLTYVNCNTYNVSCRMIYKHQCINKLSSPWVDFIDKKD